MADEPAAAPAEPDTPTAVQEAPETPDTPIQQDSPQIDYEQRYNELRSEFDRRNERWAEIEGRKGPDAQATALREYARIELEDEEIEDEANPDFEYRDPTEEIDAIRQELAERDEAQKAAEFDQLERDYTRATIDQLETDEDVKLSEEERALVEAHGFANRETHGPEEGKPDFEGGLAKLKASWESYRGRYVNGKREAVLAPVGTEGEQKVNLRDPEARRKLATEVFEAEEGRES